MAKRWLGLFLVMILIGGCSPAPVSEEAPAPASAGDAPLQERFERAEEGTFVIDEPGVYGTVGEPKRFAGEIHIAVDGVRLQNVKIDGNLYIDKGVGEGDADIVDSEITGTVYIHGGGASSVRYKRTRTKCTLVFNPWWLTRLKVDKDSKVEKAIVQSGTMIEGDTIEKVIIEPKEDAEVSLKGTFKSVEVTKPTKVAVESETRIDRLTVTETAGATEIVGEGTVAKVQVDSKRVRIDVSVDVVTTETGVKEVLVKDGTMIPDSGEADAPEWTAKNWEPGMPWDTEWGEAPEEAWTPESGIPWDPAWGEEPERFGLPSEQPEDAEEGEAPKVSEWTAENWEPGMPWDAAWGEAPEEAWTPESGIPWDPAWGEEPQAPETDNEEAALPQEELLDPVNILSARMEPVSGSKAVRLIFSVSRPAKVYYVLEDLSTQSGSVYLPSIEQVKRGNNALGSPDPQPAPEMPDGETFEFPTEAFVSGSVWIEASGQEISVLIEGPTMSGLEGEPFMESPSGAHLSAVAVDSDGHETLWQ